jgi:hypothetical protein
MIHPTSAGSVVAPDEEGLATTRLGLMIMRAFLGGCGSRARMGRIKSKDTDSVYKTCRFWLIFRPPIFLRIQLARANKIDSLQQPGNPVGWENLFPAGIFTVLGKNKGSRG